MNNILAFSLHYKATPCRSYLLMQFQWSHLYKWDPIYTSSITLYHLSSSTQLSTSHRHLFPDVSKVELLTFQRNFLFLYLLFLIFSYPVVYFNSSFYLNLQTQSISKISGFYFYRCFWLYHLLSNTSAITRISSPL